MFLIAAVAIRIAAVAIRKAALPPNGYRKDKAAPGKHAHFITPN
jgi:hypothetical protein